MTKRFSRTFDLHLSTHANSPFRGACGGLGRIDYYGNITIFVRGRDKKDFGNARVRGAESFLRTDVSVILNVKHGNV